MVVKHVTLSNIDVSEFIRKNKIHSYIELFAIAASRKEEGQSDLTAFVLARSEKVLNEILQKTWLMKEAAGKMVETAYTRMDLIQQAFSGDCEKGWNKSLLECALKVLNLNNIDVYYYAALLRDSLINGRGKFRNVILVGRSNCAITFMLKPMKKIFASRLFENPSNDKYGCIGADQADIIILEDFRYSRDLITWKDFLLLLEGETVKFPAPKNLFSSDAVISGNVSFFATSKNIIQYLGNYNTTDKRENEMMASRWKVIQFKHVFEESKQKKLKPCARCFSELVLMAEDY